jgi:hypothetical protein
MFDGCERVKDEVDGCAEDVEGLLVGNHGMDEWMRYTDTEYG